MVQYYYRMGYIELFREYMSERMERFEELLVLGYDCEPWEYYADVDPYYWIAYAFEWGVQVEGFDYWLGLSNGWMLKLEELGL